LSCLFVALWAEINCFLKGEDNHVRCYGNCRFRFAGTITEVKFNSQTEGYVPTDVSMSENKQGGVRSQLQKPVAAPGVAQDTETKPSQVDLAKEMTQMMETKNMYLANMKTVDSSEKMLGHLLDTVG